MRAKTKISMLLAQLVLIGIALPLGPLVPLHSGSDGSRSPVHPRGPRCSSVAEAHPAPLLAPPHRGASTISYHHFHCAEVLGTSAPDNRPEVRAAAVDEATDTAESSRAQPEPYPCIEWLLRQRDGESRDEIQVGRGPDTAVNGSRLSADAGR